MSIASEDAWRLRATEFKPVLFQDDHVSEGFLAPLDNGKIKLIFRFDPGIEGHHVGTNAHIASITYDPAQDRWGEVQTVYNSHRYDDRNIHGGVTNNGRILVFFRRYDGRDTEGVYAMHSDDNGTTWSEPRTSAVFNVVQGTGQMFYNPDLGKYSTMTYTRGLNEIIFSQDGAIWDESREVARDAETALSEIAGAWCGQNRVLALIRDDARKHGHPLLQVESHDNGRTWTVPKPTNIPPDKHWGCAPQLIYDVKRDLLIALTSDRHSRPNHENSLFVYTARPASVIGNPENWTLRHELLRPWSREDFRGNRPLNLSFYGYPTIAPINEREYLVVFTERARMHGTEQADLYYFRLVFE